MAHGQDAEPGDERVREEPVQPLQVADEGDVGLHGEVHGDGVVDILIPVQEAEGLGEDDLARDVEGDKGEELVQVHGPLLVGELAHPPEELAHAGVHGRLRLQHAVQEVASRQVLGAFVLVLGVQQGEGSIEPVVWKGYDDVPPALVGRPCQSVSSRQSLDIFLWTHFLHTTTMVTVPLIAHHTSHYPIAVFPRSAGQLVARSEEAMDQVAKL